MSSAVCSHVPSPLDHCSQRLILLRASPCLSTTHAYLSFTQLIPTHVVAGMSFPPQACLISLSQITHVLFTVITNYNSVFPCSPIYRPLPQEFPGKDGPCMSSSSQYTHAHHKDQSAVSKCLLNDWPNEHPFFLPLYFHLISFVTSDAEDDNLSVHFSLSQEPSLWSLFWFWPGQALSEGCHPLMTCILLCLGMQELHELAKGRPAFQTYSMVIKRSSSRVAQLWALNLVSAPSS